MERRTAEQMMAACLEMGEPIERLVIYSESIDNKIESKEFSQIVGDLMGEVYKLMLPIMRQYPDLDPDKD